MWPFGKRRQRARFAQLASERVRRLYPAATVEVVGGRLVSQGLPSSIELDFEEWFEEWLMGGSEALELLEDALAMATGIVGDRGLTP